MRVGFRGLGGFGGGLRVQGSAIFRGGGSVCWVSGWGGGILEGLGG